MVRTWASVAAIPTQAAADLVDATIARHDVGTRVAAQGVTAFSSEQCVGPVAGVKRIPPATPRKVIRPRVTLEQVAPHTSHEPVIAVVAADDVAPRAAPKNIVVIGTDDEHATRHPLVTAGRATVTRVAHADGLAKGGNRGHRDKRQHRKQSDAPLNAQPSHPKALSVPPPPLQVSNP